MGSEALAYAMIAIGLNIQWGYAGLFNVGIMGLIAAGSFASLMFTFPVNQAFWASDVRSASKVSTCAGVVR